MQVFQFKKEAMRFLAPLCSHAIEKSLLRSLFVRCLKCFSPNFLVESSRSCELMFEKILEKLVSCKQLPSREADETKLEFSNFLSTTVKENKDSFVKFNKDKFIMLRKVFKMLIILSHGQAIVERRFSVNGKLLFENLHTESVIAQRHIHDQMRSYDLQVHDLDIARKLLDSVSSARKRYFQSQKERLLSKEKSSKDCQLTKLNSTMEVRISPKIS